MSYKDTYEAYINLSRRELQGLCKKHNLPANKSQSDLARSLALHFKKKNSSLVNIREASCIPAEIKSQGKTHDKSGAGSAIEFENQLNAEDGDELTPICCILIESSQEDNNIVEAIDDTIDGIRNNPKSLDNMMSDQDLMSQSPVMRKEPTAPLEPCSNSSKSQSAATCENQELPPQFTCNDKSPVKNAAESSTIIGIAEMPVSFQFFVASEEGINLFVDLNSGPSDWFHSLKCKNCRNPVNTSCSISSLAKDVNSCHSSMLCENFLSESVPVEGTQNLSDMPTQIENKLGGIQEGEGNEEMLLSKTIEEGLKEVSEISVSELNLLEPCQNDVILLGESTDPFTKELSIPGTTDKVVILDSDAADSLLSSSEMLQDNISVPKASVNSGLTLDKNLKRALNHGSEKLSHNKKHHVAEESNKNGNFTRILRSSRTSVKETEDNISGLPRRSTRLVSK